MNVTKDQESNEITDNSKSIGKLLKTKHNLVYNEDLLSLAFHFNLTDFYFVKTLKEIWVERLVQHLSS